MKNNDSNEKIIFSVHAKKQMVIRGATENDVVQAIQSRNWLPAKRGKFHSKMTCQLSKPLDRNQKLYHYKTVDAVFSKESDEIVVITVKVYYHNNKR